MSGRIKAAKSGPHAMRGAAGDPGIFGGIVGAIRGGVGSLVRGGNPLAGAASGAVRGFSGPGGAARLRMDQAQALATANRMYATSSWGDIARATGWSRSAIQQLHSRGATGGGVPIVPTPGVSGAIQRLLPGGATGYQTANGAAAPPLPNISVGGYHPNKTGYFLKDGTYVAPGTRMVKNRRMNPLNPKALRKAITRVNGAKRWQATLREIETKQYTKAGKKKGAC